MLFLRCKIHLPQRVLRPTTGQGDRSIARASASGMADLLELDFDGEKVEEYWRSIQNETLKACGTPRLECVAPFASV